MQTQLNYTLDHSYESLDSLKDGETTVIKTVTAAKKQNKQKKLLKLDCAPVLKFLIFINVDP